MAHLELPMAPPEIAYGYLPVGKSGRKIFIGNLSGAIGNLPGVSAGARLALALTLRFIVVIIDDDQGDSAAQAADDPGKPEQT